MALRGILDIDVNSGAFDQFVDKYNQYTEAEEKRRLQQKSERAVQHYQTQQQTQNREAAKEIADAEKRHADFVKQVAASWKTVREDSRNTAQNVREISTRIMHTVADMAKFTSLLGLVGGVATGFGFLGADALGRTASGWRRAATGLGSSIGGQRAFNLDYGRFIDSNAFLSGVSTAMRDPRKRVALAALGVTPETGEDASSVANRALARARQLAQETPEQNLGMLLQARRLGDLGLSLQDLQRLRGTSDEEFAQQQGAFGRDRRSLNLTDPQARGWQDFTNTLDRARQQIETTFIVRLSPLAPALGHLADAFNKVLNALLGKPEIQKWIDDFAGALERFAHYVATDDFTKKVEGFVDGLGKMAVAIGGFLAMLAGTGSTNPRTDTPPDKPGVDPKGHWTGPPGGSLWKNPDGTVVNTETGQKYRETQPGSNIFEPAMFNGATMRAIPASLGVGTAPGQTPAFFSNLEQARGLPAGLLDAEYAAESGRGANAGTSSAGAQGPFQFLPGTAQQYGVTNPNDLQQAARGAADYLKHLLSVFHGNVAEAIAGYNWGEGNVQKDIEKYGAAWREHLPAETQAYVARILQAIHGGMMNGPRQGTNTMTAMRSPQVQVHIHNETGGNAVMSAAQISV